MNILALSSVLKWSGDYPFCYEETIGDCDQSPPPKPIPFKLKYIRAKDPCKICIVQAACQFDCPERIWFSKIEESKEHMYDKLEKFSFLGELAIIASIVTIVYWIIS